MSKRVYISLNKASDLSKAVRELRTFKNDINTKTYRFLWLLLEKGNITAKVTSGVWGRFISFTKEVHIMGDQYECLLIATDGQKVLKEWYPSKKDAEKGTNVRSYHVSPILLAEFGSGWLVDVLYAIPGVGQGTMPNSYGHAADPDGWYWYDKNGVKHHSIGEAPKYPMHNAMLRMMEEIQSTAREVWNG